MNIKKYLVDRKKEIEEIKLVKRSMQIKENVNFITSIIGPRRAGKTYYLYLLIKSRKLRPEQFSFVNFYEAKEDPSKIPFLHNEIYGVFPKYLFFDEIQEIENWEKAIYSLYEKKKYFIFVTGSSSKLLSKEIATQLRGRSIPIKIFPFSFKEVLEIKNLLKTPISSYGESKIKHELLTCLKKGTFPDIVLNNVLPSQFFSEYVDLVIHRDIEERYNIKNRFALEFFVKSVIASHTKQFSVNKTFNTMKSLNIRISKDSLYNFQKYIEDVNFCFFLKKYNKSYKKTELSVPKAFLVDNGIFSYIERGEGIGKMMEGFVFSELIKHELEVNKNLFYFDLVDGEIDFVIVDKGKVKQLIQVTYASSKDEIDKRELKALLKASDLLRCKNLLVITWDYEAIDEMKGKQVKFMPLWKWLL